MTDDPGVTVYLALDDLTSTIERGLGQEVIADGRWHLYEWDLSDDSQWNAWTGSANGILDGATVTIDSIQFAGAGNALIYLDDVAHNPDGSLLAALGDFDYNGDVDEADLNQWRTQFGTNSGASFDRGDADGDGDVDGADFLAWQRTYQPAPSNTITAVPEPASYLLVMAVLVFAFSMRQSFP